MDDTTREEALEEVAELRYMPPMRRGSSIAWWETGTTETLSEPDTLELTEYMIDSADTSISSTRASTGAMTSTTAGGEGSMVRISRAAARGFSMVVRGERSPLSLLRTGYRGRSVTRREYRMPRAAVRHRRPTHTPNRAPVRRPSSPAEGRSGLVAPPMAGEPRFRGAMPATMRLLGQQHAGLAGRQRLTFHTVGRVHEEQE